MSIARALTKRYKVNLHLGQNHSQNDEAPQTSIERTMSIKKFDKPIDRSKISLPLELISTTNVLAYDAPDIHPMNPTSPLSASSTSSRKSWEGSESGASVATGITTPHMSREPSPTATEANHMGNYFHQSFNKPSVPIVTPPTPLSATFKETEIAPTGPTPAVPSRALSHTKKTHQALARKRSQTRLSNGENGIPAIPQSPVLTARSSAEIFSSNPEPVEHPFEAELAQIGEVAEEFGVQDITIWSEEEQFLIDQGFGRFAAEDYMNEIEPLFGKAFYDEPTPTSPTWL